MKKLDLVKTRKVDGVEYTHTQIIRKNFPNGRSVCIYDMQNMKSGEVEGFEVFIPRMQKKDVQMMNANYISPAGEKYPGNNDFGLNASQISGEGSYDEKLERAEVVFDEFCDRIEASMRKDIKKDQLKNQKK